MPLFENPEMSVRRPFKIRLHRETLLIYDLYSTVKTFFFGKLNFFQTYLKLNIFAHGRFCEILKNEVSSPFPLQFALGI